MCLGVRGRGGGPGGVMHLGGRGGGGGPGRCDASWGVRGSGGGLGGVMRLGVCGGGGVGTWTRFQGVFGIIKPPPPRPKCPSWEKTNCTVGKI